MAALIEQAMANLQGIHTVTRVAALTDLQVSLELYLQALTRHHTKEEA